MPAHSNAVGVELDINNVDMTARKALAYAAGIADITDQVFDDNRDGGIIVPPAFCVSLEWPVVSGPVSKTAYGMAADERVLKDPKAEVKVGTLADSSVNMLVRPWVATDDYWDVYWDLTREVKLRFDAMGVSIPFPQRDVHLYNTERPSMETNGDPEPAPTA